MGHTKGYIQVLVIAPESILGTSANVKITSVGRWSVFGEVIGTPDQTIREIRESNFATEYLEHQPCDKCSCSREPEPCQCADQNSCSQELADNGLEKSLANVVPDNPMVRNHKPGNFVSLAQSIFLRRRIRGAEERSHGDETKSAVKPILKGQSGQLATLDWILVCGMLASFITAVGLVMLLSSKI